MGAQEYALSTAEDTSNLTPQQIVARRRIFGGPSDIVRSISINKYPWAREMMLKMMENHWQSEEAKLVNDKQQFLNLLKGEQTAYKRALGFLSNLDAIQVENIAENISTFVTDPSIRSCLRRQAWEEELHVDSYSRIIETVIPDPVEVYDMARQIPTLAIKNAYVLAQASKLSGQPTEADFVKALVSNIILEGQYFYSGFLTFYTIGNSRGTIQGSIDMIRFIQRDEVTHLKLFELIYKAYRAEARDVFTKTLADECRHLIWKGAQLEKAWGRFVIEEGCLGLTDTIMDGYNEYRAEFCANLIDLDGVFPNAKNPVGWVDKYSQVKNTETNFFEAKPKAYSKREVKWD